jgi:hypothetical protein
MGALDPGQEAVTSAEAIAEDGDGESEKPKSKRDLAMEAIDASRKRDLDVELGTAAAGEVDPDEQREPAKRRVKVDGDEFEVDDEDLVREYQKGRTADRRLEQAAVERKQIEAERVALAAERAEWARSQAAGGTRAASASDGGSQATAFGEDDEPAKEIYEALVSGDEDTAVAAIKKLTAGRQDQAIPPEQVAARVRQQIAWEDAQAQFAQDYQDITADPLLRQIASNTLAETLKGAKSYNEAFREAGDRTRAWVRGAGGSAQGGGAQAQPGPGLAERQSRKERIDNPTAINARAAGKPQAQPETAGDVIKQMRQARGLSV